MRTDHLIELLAAALKPVSRNGLLRPFITAFAIGVAGSLGAMFLLASPPHDPLVGWTLFRLSMRVIFGVGVVAMGALLLQHFARPAAKPDCFQALASFPYGAATALVLLAYALAYRLTSGSIISHRELGECLVYVPLFSIVPFAAAIRVLGEQAPTDLRRAGAAAGLFACGLGITACAVPCAGEPFPHVALWHALAIQISAELGAGLGPRLLRW